MSHAAYSYRDDPDVPDFKDDKPVIVFDGYCVLCSRWANFVIRHDTAKRYRLLAAQSDLGEALYTHFGKKSGDYDTNILLENGLIRVKSDGSLAMFSGLGLPWSLMTVFRVIPRPVRDWMYDRLARNRFKWFGKREHCYLPPVSEKDRFL